MNEHVNPDGQVPEIAVTCVLTVRLTCASCGDPSDHELAVLANGDTLVTCGDCDTATVLEVM